MIVGFALGIFQMIVDTPVALGMAEYSPGSFLWIVNNIFFQCWSVLITIVKSAYDPRAGLRLDPRPHLRRCDRGTQVAPA
jgi:hypothetical protein